MKENKDNLLLIFTRNPELGKCKTRLAATVGDQTALDIYLFLLEHTANITKNLQAAKQVHYSVFLGENDIWENEYYDKTVQHGADLGIRMANAFKAGFRDGFKKIIIIGSDVYDISQEDLENAFKQLDEVDYVIGPAEDGGYYLFGMRTFIPSLFKDKEWGTSSVFEKTMDDLKNKNVHLLEMRNDVDIYEDIKNEVAFEPFLKDIK